MTDYPKNHDGSQKEFHNLLRKDIAGFADPGMRVTIKEDDTEWVSVDWVMRGERCGAEFLLGSSDDLRDVIVRIETGVQVSYGSFLAGPNMANLRRLSANIVNLVRDDSSYVAPYARLDNSLEDVEKISANTLIRHIAKGDDGRTNVVFLTAQAGVGKTSLLRHVVHAVAKDYRSGQADALWLYVDAQGRRLAKLDDAISGELGKLRAQFSFDAVAALVRVGCLVLVVDGFDELLGIQGSYDESFSSLASFLDELQSSGCVVAAARSAYYEQEFVGRVNSAIGFRADGWVVNRVRLQSWDVDQLNSYVEARSAREALSPAQVIDVKEKVSTAFASDSVRHLQGMPFFVSRVTDLILKGTTLSSGADLLEQLVNSYVSREAKEKLRDSPGGRSYLNDDQLREVFSEIAEEMWRQDTRELSRTSLREILEVWLDVAGLPSEAQLAIVDRGPYSALLQSADKGAVKFEHDVYYSYFLAGPIVELTRKGDPLPLRQALRRSQLPVEAADMAGARLRTHASDHLAVLMTACERQDASTEQVRQNAGTVAAGIMRAHSQFEAMEIQYLHFVDCDLSRITFKESAFRDCSFTGSDLREFRLVSCRGEHLSFERVGVDPSGTRLDISGVPVTDFRALRLFGEDANGKTVYDPRVVSEVLASCGLPEAQTTIPLRPVNVEVVRLLDDLSWLFSKTNYFTEQDGTADVRRAVEHAHWRTVRNVMVDAGCLTWSKRQTSGNKDCLRVHVPPNDLMAGRDSQATVVPAVRRLWEALEGLFPE